MKTPLILVLALACLGTMPVVAQTQSGSGAVPPPGPPHPPIFGPHPGFWKDSEIVTKLQLTDAQRTQLEKIFTEHRGSFSANREQLRAAEEAARTALEQNPPDEATYNANVAKIETLRTQVAQEFASLALAFRKTLTVDQWKALEQLEQQHQGFKHHDKNFHGQGSGPE